MAVARKQELLQELLPLARANGIGAELLATMQTPGWLAAVATENLEHLLALHRELRRLHVENEGVYERWQAARERRPGPETP